MVSGLFWPDCIEPGCPMLEEGFRVGGRNPPAWSMAGLLHRKQQLEDALRPFAVTYHKNLENMPTDSTVTIKVSMDVLRYAVKVLEERQ